MRDYHMPNNPRAMAILASYMKATMFVSPASLARSLAN